MLPMSRTSVESNFYIDTRNLTIRKALCLLPRTSPSHKRQSYWQTLQIFLLAYTSNFINIHFLSHILSSGKSELSVACHIYYYISYKMSAVRTWECAFLSSTPSAPDAPQYLKDTAFPLTAEWFTELFIPLFFIYSFIQHILIKYLVCARHWTEQFMVQWWKVLADKSVTTGWISIRVQGLPTELQSQQM